MLGGPHLTLSKTTTTGILLSVLLNLKVYDRVNLPKSLLLLSLQKTLYPIDAPNSVQFEANGRHFGEGETAE